MSTPDVFPEIDLGNVRAGTVAARYERRAFCHDGFQGGADVLHAFDAGGIAFWSNQHEIVVHHRIALHALAFGKEFFFR